jgi:tripartite-type tricarboxylate transporter receptor subunit TctC
LEGVLYEIRYFFFIKKTKGASLFFFSVRRYLRFFACLTASLLLPSHLIAQAQSFPNKPIKLIIPHAAGGNSDTFARILTQKLSERIGQQVVVENKVDAGGTNSGAVAE